MFRKLALAVTSMGLFATPLVAYGVEAEMPEAKPAPAFVIQDPRITESSGLTPSTWRDGYYFTHNDAGDVPRVFAIDSTGATAGVVHLHGARNIDWEDIAGGPRHTLWVADTGNDRLRRRYVAVYRFKEPRGLDGRTGVRPTKFRFYYPGRTQDAEALLVHPKTGRVFLVTEGEDTGAVYRAPRRLSSRHANKLTRIGRAPADVTGAAFAPDGSGFVLGTQSRVYEYNRLSGQPEVTELDPQLTRSESVSYTADSESVLVGSEGLLSPVFQERRRTRGEVPDTGTPTPTDPVVTPPPTDGSTTPPPTDVPTTPPPTTPPPTTPPPTTPPPTTPPPVTSVPLVGTGSTWAYRYDAVAPTGDWNLNRYDDRSWQRGPAPIGFGSSTVATSIDIQPTDARPRAAYFRKAFNLKNVEAIESVTLTTKADDGVAVYVNGVEVLRSNLPQSADHYGYATSAISTSVASPVTVVVPGSAFRNGYNTITADTHVNYRATSNITFDLSAVAKLAGSKGVPVVSAPVFEPPAPVDGPGDLPGWDLDLVDNFDTFDTSTWWKFNEEGWAHEDSFVLARNATTSDGMMRLHAKLEEAGGRHFTTGEISSRGAYSLPNYFRIEVRAKVPLERGMWAAPIWLRPETPGAAGEIDLVETYGKEKGNPYVHQTIHTDYGSAHQQTHFQTPFSRYPGTATGWHTYVIEKTPGQIVMWVDGIKSATFNRTTTPWYDKYYEVGTRWSMRSSLQVGGWDVPPDATTDWSKTSTYLDYVHTWVPK